MYKSLIILFILSVSFSGQVFSSNIKGFVYESGTGEVIPGAILYIRELDLGTTSGLDGSYLLNTIPNGNFTLQVKYLGYEDLEQNITISNDENISLSLYITPQTQTLDVVTVQSTATKNSEISARQTERNSPNIVNVVSARAIQLSPDLQIANVVQRISGITLESNNAGGAQYTLMRGMDKRYNYTTVNGVKIPSTNNQHRYVSLDIFPSDMVDRVEVKKALTPDMEGDAIAGAVNLEMKEAPQSLLVQASVGAGYNFFFSDNDFLTFDSKVLAKESPFEIYGKDHYASPSEFPKENLNIKTIGAPIDQTVGLTLGNRFINNKLGVMVSGSYLHFYKGDNRLDFTSDVEKNDPLTLNLPTLSSRQESSYYNNKKNYGIHARIDYVLSPRTSIKLYSAFINAKSEQLRETDHTNLEVSYDPENGAVSGDHSTRFRLNEQYLNTNILQGLHELITGRLNADWSMVYSKAVNTTPDEATVSYYDNLKNYEPYNLYVDFDGSKRLWRHNTDQDLSAYLNFIYSFPTSGKNSTWIKAGAMYRRKTRESFYNSYTLQAIVPVSTPDTSYTSFYSEKDVDWETYPDINWKVYNPRGTIATGENFNSHEYILSGYGMFNIDINKWKLVGGVRIEHTDQGYVMDYPIGQPRPDGKQEYVDVLPSLHFNYKVSETQNLRLSYFKATNRPGFLEIVPCPVIDDNENKSKGNPDLNRASADNIDLRWEYFPKALDQVMVGLFYKNIKDAIEYAFVRDGSSQDIYYSPINSDRAMNMGFELDAIKYFREFGVRGNYTFTVSDISTPKLLYTRDANGDLVPNYDVVQERPLYGQSMNVGNLSLLYKGVNNDINVQLAFSYTSERIYTVSRYYENDYWQKGFWQFDASFNKTFKNGISLYVKANNLLSTKFTGFIKNTNAYNAQFPEHSIDDVTTLVRSDYAAPSFIVGIRYDL